MLQMTNISSPSIVEINNALLRFLCLYTTIILFVKILGQRTETFIGLRIRNVYWTSYQKGLLDFVSEKFIGL